ncbi:MAG: TnpV protein [Clostridia bacterium]|nr:TnpV protein [Clostridia bacterium]
MEKVIYDEKNGLWYELQGDYYIPCLKLPDEERVEIGVWGMRHLEYIKHHRKGFYTSLLIGCELNRYLADVNMRAEEMFDTLISQYKISEGVTEKLKAENQMEWVGRMNNIKQRVVEIINEEIIYA